MGLRTGKVVWILYAYFYICKTSASNLVCTKMIVHLDDLNYMQLIFLLLFALTNSSWLKAQVIEITGNQVPRPKMGLLV